MLFWKKMKQSLNHYFENLAKANQSVFKGETADCCKLNQDQSQVHKPKRKE